MPTQPLSTLAPAVRQLDLPLRWRRSLALPWVEPEALLEYQRFLSLCQWHAHDLLMPTGAAWRLWQAHILDTRAYRADCETLFGRFLDHFPWLGVASAADLRERVAAQQRYRQLYARHFPALSEPPDTSS